MLFRCVDVACCMLMAADEMTLRKLPPSFLRGTRRATIRRFEAERQTDHGLAKKAIVTECVRLAGPQKASTFMNFMFYIIYLWLLG